MTVRGVEVTVNGRVCTMQVEPRTLLSDALRDQLGLTGLHAACEQGACGSCTVLLDDRSVRSCLMFAVQAERQAITTIEGVGDPLDLHPVQEAFHRHHGLQCGFCTPGMVLTALELLAAESRPSRDEIATWMSGNLCRCTGYEGIVDAIASLTESDGESTDDASTGER